MKTKRPHRLAAALCALALLLALLPAPAYAADGPAVSSNINKQDYSTWSSTVKSYLYDNGSGLTRVEYINGSIVVEDYDADFNYLSGRTIPMELSIWGGFYAGKDANYFVFGQNNPSESNSTEVIRVVKYSKDWQRQGQASLKGANTVAPFEAGSLRCDEYGGYLYIRTCHKMYTSSDGLNHQANLTFSVKESDMTVADSYYEVMNNSYGYVSHSFNQFIIVDQSGRIITLDHGDAYPRAIVWMAYYADASSGKFTGSQYSAWCSSQNLIEFPGTVGANATGGSAGGLEETSSCYIMAFNSDGQGGGGSRAVYLNVTNKAAGTSKQYKIDNGGDNTTPVLAPVDLGGGYMLWNTKSGGRVTDTLCYVAYIDGGAPSSVQQAVGSLSDCQPVSFNGGVVWYVTNNSAPVFYTLSAKGLQSHPAGTGGGSPAQTDPAEETTPDTTPDTTAPDTAADTTTPDTTTDTTADPVPSGDVNANNPYMPQAKELDARNIDPNSPKPGDVIGGDSSCRHVHDGTWLWYWSGTAGTTSCTENSYSYYTCTNCGAKLVNGIMYAPGHNYKDGVCTVCGEKDPDAAAQPETSGTPAASGGLVTGSKDLPSLSKQEIIDLLNQNATTLPSQVFDVQPSVSAPYQTGKLSDAVLQAGLNRLNALRRIAGLPAATLDKSWTESAQYGAVILGKLGTLSHTPTQPSDMSKDFYENAYAATYSSNLSAGRTFLDAIDGLMSDAASSNITSAGHRRWQLSPALSKVGFGYVDNGSGYRTFTVVKVFDRGAGASSHSVDYDSFGWPSAGNFPNDLLGFTNVSPWTVSLNPDIYAAPSGITVKISGGGKTWTLSGSYAATDTGAYLSVTPADGWNYGNNHCIIFRPDGVTKYEGVYTVEIQGLKYKKDNSAAPFTYTVDFFSTTQPATDETTPTTPTTPATPSTSTTAFTDIPAGSYYADAVVWALEKGITTGATATTFAPNATCERGQVATFLWRAMGSPEPKTTTNPFRDVPASSPYYKAILWAYENGIVTGATTTTFEPYATCTNGHVVTMLWRAEGKPAAAGTSSIAQSFPTDYYTDAVAWADTAGLLKDTGAAFNPNSQSPRSNIVTYLYRSLAE